MMGKPLEICPVCGLAGFEAFDVSGQESFAICNCCGCESGYEYQSNTTENRLFQLRREWLFERNGDWFQLKARPKDWNALRQLQIAGLEIPE